MCLERVSIFHRKMNNTNNDESHRLLIIPVGNVKKWEEIKKEAR